MADHTGSTSTSRSTGDVRESMKARGWTMLRDLLTEAIVEAIAETERRHRAGDAGGRYDWQGEGGRPSESGRSSSKLGWLVPLGAVALILYLGRKKMSNDGSVQKSITEWKDERSSDDGGESALSGGEDAGYGADESGMNAPEGVDDDESGRAESGSESSEDDAAETTETT